MACFWLHCLLLLFALSHGHKELPEWFGHKQKVPGPVIPIYTYDDPHDCRYQNGAYCFVTTVRWMPENARDVWDYPRRLSVDYHPEVLEWGMCTKHCQNDLDELSNMDKVLLTRPRLSASNLSLKYPEYYFPERENWEQIFGDMLHVCVNWRLASQYNLTAYPDLESCFTSAYVPWKLFDWYTCIFYVILFSSIVSFAMGNILDLCGPGIFKGFILVRVTSFRNSWLRLCEPTDEDRDHEKRSIHNLCFYLNVLVMGFNCFMMMIAFPWENTADIEAIVKSPYVINVLSCMFGIIPLFFTIDGFIMMRQLQHERDKLMKPIPRFLMIELLDRMLRTFPVYFMVLLYSTVMDSISGGKPTIGRYVMLTRESRFCRQNFWYNFFLVHNYPQAARELCFAPGWYYAATTHLYIGGGLVVLYALRSTTSKKMRQHIKRIAPCVCVVLFQAVGAFWIPSTALPPLQMNDIHTNFTYQTWYRTMYLPTWMNIGCYAVGMVSGYHVHKVKGLTSNVMNGAGYHRVKRYALPVLLFTVCFPFVFYNLNWTRPGFITSAYSVLFSNAGSVFLALCLLRRFRNLPLFLQSFLEVKCFRLFYKLNFCMYMVHPLVIRWFLSLKDPRHGFELSHFPLLFGQVFVITVLYAFIMFMLVEAPSKNFIISFRIFRDHDQEGSNYVQVLPFLFRGPAEEEDRF